MIKVVPFAGTFTYASKYRQTAMRFGNIVNQLHHVYGFTHTRTTKQTNFAAFCKRAKQINHLNTGFQQFGCTGQFIKFRSRLVNRTFLRSINWPSLIYRITKHIHDASQSSIANWYTNGFTRINNCVTAFQAIGRAHSNRTDNTIAQLLLDL